MTAAGAERTWRLDPGAGWQAGRLDGIVAGPRGALSLVPLPGRAEQVAVTEPPPWVWPSALAGHPSRGLLVTDAGAHVVTSGRLSGPGARTLAHVAPLPTIGGRGHGLRRMRRPGGVALLARGAFAVADTDHHRVQVFSAPPYALLRVWGATDAQGRPASGRGLLEFDRPQAIAADEHGTLHVADCGNGRVQRIDRAGAPQAPLGDGLLTSPARLAVRPDGTVAVADHAQRAVWVFTPSRTHPFELPDLDGPRSVAFAPDGRLFVGDENGRLDLFTPTDRAAEPWRRAGSGVTGLDGSIEDLIWWGDETASLLLLVRRDDERGAAPRLWAVDPSGGCTLEGSMVLGPLDSRIDRCAWHRGRFDADVPQGGSLDIQSFTADAADARPSPLEAGFTGWQRSILAGESRPDCLIQSTPGRYLWLRIGVRSNGAAAPVIRGIRLSYPRTSHLQYLPAVFQEDDESRLFLERFLAIFQSGFDDFDAAIDRVPELFDPYLTPEKHLRWLAAWVAVAADPGWPEARLREQVAVAVSRALRRGTADGLRQAIRDHVDVESRVLEHFRLRRWLPSEGAAALDGSSPLFSRDIYQRLQLSSYSQVGRFRLADHPEPAIEPVHWGAHRFSVFFVADPYRAGETRERVGRVVAREKPAHTEATLCPVYPRFRVGVQASVGVDTVVGTVSHLVLNRLATLNYDTILACSCEEHTLRAMGAAVRPAVGTTTRLP